MVVFEGLSTAGGRALGSEPVQVLWVGTPGRLEGPEGRRWRRRFHDRGPGVSFPDLAQAAAWTGRSGRVPTLVFWLAADDQGPGARSSARALVSTWGPAGAAVYWTTPSGHWGAEARWPIPSGRTLRPIRAEAADRDSPEALVELLRFHQALGETWAGAPQGRPFLRQAEEAARILGSRTWTNPLGDLDWDLDPADSGAGWTLLGRRGGEAPLRATWTRGPSEGLPTPQNLVHRGRLEAVEAGYYRLKVHEVRWGPRGPRLDLKDSTEDRWVGGAPGAWEAEVSTQSPAVVTWGEVSLGRVVPGRPYRLSGDRFGPATFTAQYDDGRLEVLRVDLRPHGQVQAAFLRVCDLVLVTPGTQGPGACRPFLLGATAVTEGHWDQVMGGGGRRTGAPGRPVTQVSWLEALEYCNRRSEAEGRLPCYLIQGDEVQWLPETNGYRLPTEREWLAALEANGPLDRTDPAALGWFLENSVGEPHPVATLSGGRLGLYDLLGNVWEWCWDGPPRADRPLRRICGGAWSTSWAVRGLDLRAALAPDFRHLAVGFRVACDRT